MKKRYGANESPCSTPATMSKLSVSHPGGGYTRMLQAILNKSWRQHPTKQQLYDFLPPSRKLSKLDEQDVLDTVGEVVTYSCGPLHMDEQRLDDQLEPTFNSSVLLQDVALKTYQKRWMIERGGRRESGRSMLVMRHDDDDDDVYHHHHHYIYIYIYMKLAYFFLLYVLINLCEGKYFFISPST